MDVDRHGLSASRYQQAVTSPGMAGAGRARTSHRSAVRCLRSGSVQRIAVAGAVTTALLLATGATGATETAEAATPARQLELPEGRLRPGDAVVVSGTGFLLPEPQGCEITWDGPAPAGTRCGIDGVVYAAIAIGQLAEGAGTHTVTVCVPTCANPWAGSDSAMLTVDGGAAPDPQPTDVESAGEDPPPDDESPGDEFPDDEFPGDQSPGDQFPGDQSPGDRFPGDEFSGDEFPGTGLLDTAVPTSDAAVVRFAVAAPAGMAMEPDPAGPGDVVSVVARSLPGDYDASPDCELTWDGAPAGQCTADAAGSLTGSLVVPEAVTEGDHEIVVCRPFCSDAVGGQESGTVVVVAAPTGEATDGPTDPATSTATEPATETPTVTESPTTTVADPGEESPGMDPAEEVLGVVAGPGGWDWLPVVVLIAGLLLLGAAASVAQSRRLAHVRAAPALRACPDPSPEVRTQVSSTGPRSPTLRLHSRPDPDPTIVTEVHDDHAR